MDGVHDVGPSRHATDGHAAAEALGRRDQVGDEAEVLAGEHLARAGHASLDLVGDKDDAVLLAVLGDAGKKLSPGMMTPPSPWTGSASTQAMRLPPICLSMASMARSAQASPQCSGLAPAAQR